MTGGSPASVALLAAAAVHLGFQLTVTTVVYPALAQAQDWSAAHSAHTRRITPLVGLVYGLLVLACAWALVAARRDGWILVSVGGAAVSVLCTAMVAGPTHGRLSGDRDERLLGRLLAADQVRAAGALVSAVSALVAVLD